MCGFTGILLADPKARVDVELLVRMTRTLAHRGPDDEGTLVLRVDGYRTVPLPDPPPADVVAPMRSLMGK